MDDYLAKPLDVAGLHAMLARFGPRGAAAEGSAPAGVPDSGS
jgi:hypothetical protein